VKLDALEPSDAERREAVMVFQVTERSLYGRD
jgi:hypothetical protein